jgi:SAM-dependent methyltransferase
MTQPTPVPQVFDRPALRARLKRADDLGAATFLLARVVEEAVERLNAILREFPEALDLGTPTAALQGALTSRLKHLDAVAIPDDERLGLTENSCDLVVSALALQFVNDLPGVLAQVRLALRPDGLLLAALIGGETLTELRQAFAAAETEREGGLSPRVAPLADLRDVGGLLQRARFALPVVDLDRVVVRYDNAIALMHDLRRMAATNILTQRRRTPLSRATLARMTEIYAEHFSDPDGRIRATFDIVWVAGWKPHPRQQQPLKPGSAKARLEDAIKGRTGPKADRSGAE